MVTRTFSKVYTVPKKPYDKDRLIDEMKIVGTFGLRNKRELWRAQKECDSNKRKAIDLLICPNQDHKITKGRELLNKLMKAGILVDPELKLTNKNSIQDGLNKILNLSTSDYLKRRLQFRVFELGLASNVHHARILIFQRQICVKGRVVDKPGFMVSAENEQFVEVNAFSVRGGTKKSKRTERRKEKQKEMNADAEAEAEEEDE